jgi:hypothetical protein
MKSVKLFLLAALMITAAASCKKEQYEVDYNLDPNAPPSDLYLNNATAQQINALGVGLQSVMRSGFVDFTRNAATVGREVITSASTDNRYFTELLGTNTVALGGANDPAGIFNGYYSSYSQTRRRAEQFITSAKNTNSISATQKSAVEGFAKTVQAFVTLNLALMQGNPNGQHQDPQLSYMAPGPGKTDPWITGGDLAKLPGTDCSYAAESDKDDPKRADRQKQSTACKKARCLASNIWKAPKNYFNADYNPEGKYQVISFCDGAQQGASPYMNSWAPPDPGNPKPVNMVLAVDKNGTTNIADCAKAKPEFKNECISRSRPLTGAEIYSKARPRS